MNRALLALAATLLVPSTADGLDSERAPATLFIPPGQRWEGEPYALLLNSMDAPFALPGFRMTAESALALDGVDIAWEIRALTFGYAVFRDTNRTPFTNLALVTEEREPRRGYVGIHADPATSHVVFEPTGPCAAEPAEDSLIFQGVDDRSGVDERNHPESPVYYHRIREAHLHASCIGQLTLHGTFIIQIQGLLLNASGDWRNATYDTGATRQRDQTGAIDDRRLVWVNIEVKNATLVIEGNHVWEMALADVRSAPAVPEDAAFGLGPLSVIRDDPRMQAGALVFLGLSVLTGGVLFRQARRRRLRTALEDPREAWDAEECMRRADVHIQCERFHRALEWVDKARALAPTSASVRATEGFLLGALGRVDEALATYVEASRLSPHDGEADLSAARLAIQNGYRLEVVEESVERALERSPHLVQEVDLPEGEFEVLQGRPRYDRAVKTAWDSFVGSVSGK